MTSFGIASTSLPGLTVVERTRVEDHRGFFSRFFCSEELKSIGFSEPIAQINHTLTRKRGAIRGLHFQRPPCAEIKYVSVLRGEVFDVVVDLRKTSPTFLKWHALHLSAENRLSLLVPKGFAHGFQALTDNCELFYLHSTPYSSHAEDALHVNDPLLGINWPLPITEISKRDASHPFLSNRVTGFMP